MKYLKLFTSFLFGPFNFLSTLFSGAFDVTYTLRSKSEITFTHPCISNKSIIFMSS